MNKIIALSIVFILLMVAVWFNNCTVREMDLDNPDPVRFVNQLKSGTYNQYEMGENNKKLWTKMPVFKKSDIPELLKLSNDTSHIYRWECFPVNPISSISSARFENDKGYIITGEYLLWCIEGIIRKSMFPSLIPKLKKVDTSPDKWLTGKEILIVKSIYEDWWKNYGTIEPAQRLPLEGTVYRW
jgi:hypothetical protein